VSSKQKNIIPLLLSGGFLVLWFVAPLFPGRFTWGFDLLRYFSSAFRLAWLLIGLGALAFALFSRFPEAPQSPAGRPALSPVILLSAGLVLSILLRVRIPLLGDGILRSQEISFGRLFSFTEPLTTLVHGLLYRLLTVVGLRANPAELAYRITSITAGTAALLLYFLVAGRQSDKKLLWPLVLIMAGAGYNQIFYGYVESYGLFMAAVAWYLFQTGRRISDPGHSFIPAVLAGTAAALHGSGIFLLPSLFFYWKSRSYFSAPAGRKRLLLELLCFSAIPAAALTAGFLLAPSPQVATSLAELNRRSLLPLWGGLWGYGIFSPGHWLDILNQLLLTAPVSLLLVVWAKSKAGFFKDPAGKFLGLAAFSGLLFALIVDPKLGTARDWDLLAWPFAALMFLAVRRALSSGLSPGRWAAAAVLSAWLFAPWVLVNASAERSLARYTDLLASDKRSAAYGYENLAIYHRDQHHPEKEEWAYRMAMENDSLNPRHIYNYALALSKGGKYRQSLPHFQRSLQLDPGSAKRWNDYGAALINCQMGREARAALNRALEIEPGNGNALYNMGVADCLVGSWSQADSFFTLTQETGFSDPWLYFYWGEVKLRLKQYGSAEKYLRAAIDAGIQDSLLFDAYQQAQGSLREKP
jgi:tetratricopeptide (TPR) repeat protein